MPESPAARSLDPETLPGAEGIVDPDLLAGLEPSRHRELLARALASPLPFDRQVFVNRTLRMEKIRHVGFDLDWTLADYHHEAMSELAFELTLERLVDHFDYPRAILNAEFRGPFCRRGSIIDTAEGTVLKMNRHRYVGRAYHGRRYLQASERSTLYRREPINPSSKRFYFVDTLFELPEVNIFSELVELRNQGVELPSYQEIFQHGRQAIDSIHADGTLKQRILADLDRYLPRDPQLTLALVRLALGGRRLLLITNSEWYYTDALCRHLFDGTVPGIDSWRELFDIVVVEARKPGFFRKTKPFVELDDEGHPQGEVTVPEWGKVYSGGSRENLMELLDCPGEQVIYVGDHIYGDVVSSKLTSTWRTALVVRELEEEIRVRRRLSSQERHLRVLRAELSDFGQRMDDLQDVLALYQRLAKTSPKTGDAVDESEHARSLANLQHELASARSEHKAMRQHAARLQRRVSRAINSYWGSLFKQGGNKSLFGSQVDDFACVYTSRVTNFLHYGSNHYFRVLHDAMMHETEP